MPERAAFRYTTETEQIFVASDTADASDLVDPTGTTEAKKANIMLDSTTVSSRGIRSTADIDSNTVSTLPVEITTMPPEAIADVTQSSEQLTSLYSLIAGTVTTNSELNEMTTMQSLIVQANTQISDVEENSTNDQTFANPTTEGENITGNQDLTAESVTASVIESVTESVTGPVTESGSNNVTESVTADVTEAMTEIDTESVTESAGENLGTALKKLDFSFN